MILAVPMDVIEGKFFLIEKKGKLYQEIPMMILV